MKPKRKNVQKDILFIFISSFIVVAAWVGFNIYHIWATSTVSQDVQEELMPINPDFDPQTMEQLKSRENIAPLFTSQQSIKATPTPSVLTTPIPTQATLVTPNPAVSVAPSTIPSGAPSGTSQISPTSSIDRVGQ